MASPVRRGVPLGATDTSNPSRRATAMRSKRSARFSGSPPVRIRWGSGSPKRARARRRSSPSAASSSAGSRGRSGGWDSSQPPGPFLALADLDIGTLAGAQVELARPGDLLLGVIPHLLPLRQPSARPRDGEEHREHFHGKAHGLIDQSRIEVDVWIELARDEVLVLQRDALELEGYQQERAWPGHLEDLVGHPLDDPGAGVVVLVHAMAEAHELGLPLLDPFDEGRDVILGPDLLQHA